MTTNRRESIQDTGTFKTLSKPAKTLNQTRTTRKYTKNRANTFTGACPKERTFSIGCYLIESADSVFFAVLTCVVSFGTPPLMADHFQTTLKTSLCLSYSITESLSTVKKTRGLQEPHMITNTQRKKNNLNLFITKSQYYN